MRGRSGRETPGDLLEGEVVPDLQEGGEEPLAGDPCLQVVIGAAKDGFGCLFECQIFGDFSSIMDK